MQGTHNSTAITLRARDSVPPAMVRSDSVSTISGIWGESVTWRGVGGPEGRNLPAVREPTLFHLLTWRWFHRPIFVVGTGRSGTTILLEALGTHPNLLRALGEAPIIAHLGGVAYRYDCGADDDYLRRTVKISEKRFFRLLRKICFESTTGRDYGLFMRAKGVAERAVRYRRFILTPGWTRHWVANTYPDRDSYEGICALYPQARFLWIHRSGIDVVKSRMRFAGFKHMTFSKHCETWAQSVERYRWVADSEVALELRHEELVTNSIGFFSRVHEFLELSDHPNPAKFAQGTLVHPLDQRSKGHVDVKASLSERKSAWLDWTPDQRETFKRICAEAMAEMNYPVPF